MKNLKEYLLQEKLTYKSPITKKICKAFGLKEQDDFTDAIDKWVNDNNIADVNFYANAESDLKDMNMPKSVISMYSYDANVIKKIEKIIKNTETLASYEEGFYLLGSNELLAFMSDYGDELFAYVN